MFLIKKKFQVVISCQYIYFIMMIKVVITRAITAYTCQIKTKKLYYFSCDISYDVISIKKFYFFNQNFHWPFNQKQQNKVIKIA